MAEKLLETEVKMKIPMIAITGGPCAGKTTALAEISQWCQEHDFHPIIAPEAATNLINSGLNPLSDDFQSLILKDILHNEKLRLKAARSGRYRNPVLICDRGRMDGQAYVRSPIDFEESLRKAGLTITGARDVYDGVICLDSAADGAEEFYTTSNNPARREGVQDAIILNNRTKAAWHGTPHLIIIDNKVGEDFDRKMQRCIEALARILGVPVPIECERKFKLLEFDPSQLSDTTVEIQIVQTYLVSTKPGVTERVRARGQHNHWFYFHTTKEPLGPGEVIEHDRLISKEEYESLLVRRDVDRKPIIKTRHCFAFQDQYCEVDEFAGHLRDLTMLEVELHSMEQPVTIPDFLGPYVEVTDDPDYSNAALALVA